MPKILGAEPQNFSRLGKQTPSICAAMLCHVLK